MICVQLFAQSTHGLGIVVDSALEVNGVWSDVVKVLPPKVGTILFLVLIQFE
jgi:hypothetical protein